MSRKKATKVVSEKETSLSVRGSVYPAGFGRAVSAQIELGDGYAPCILIRFGSEGENTTVAEVTAGGFNHHPDGGLKSDLRGVGELLRDIAKILMEQEPIKVPAAKEATPDPV